MSNIEINHGHNTAGCAVFVAEKADHTPFNKRHGEVNAHAKFRATYYDGSKANKEAWLTVSMSEMVQDKNGNWRDRTISFDIIGADEIAKFREVLNTATVDADRSRPLGLF